MPRVLYCTDTYPPQVNGVSVLTAGAVRGLARRGWQCAVVAPRYPADADSALLFARPRVGPTFEVSSVPLPGAPDVRLAVPRAGAVAAFAARFAPDLVHCTTAFVLGRLGQRVARRLDVPLVTSHHTDLARATAAYGAPWLHGPVARYLGRFHRRAHRVYTPSCAAREDLLARGVRGVEIWGRGVDLERFHPRQRAAGFREELVLGRRFTFLFVGRLAAEKDVERIAAAYAQMREWLPMESTRLVIAGVGPCELAIRAMAPPGVVLLGQLDRETELPRLYASADAFVFASTTATLGLVVLEAMASGLPVIAAPAGGVAEHLRHGENGLAYAPGDTLELARAMHLLATNPPLARRLGRGARRTAEALSWEAELDRLDASYREVLADAAAVRARGPATSPRLRTAAPLADG
jgi:glycosyltransferase involved in cell wall biosynthesis